MGIIRQCDNCLEFQAFGEKVIITPYGENCIRFRSSPNLQPDDNAWTLLPAPASAVSVTVNEHGAVMVNGKLEVRLDPNGIVSYYSTGGKELLAEQWWGESVPTAYLHNGREYRHVAADIYEARVYFKPYADEHFYGLGQDPNDCFDLKGTTSELCHKNTRVSIPFLLSSRGYGFIWNNPAVGRVETVHNHTLWQAYETRQVDYLVIAGDTPKDIVYTMTGLTGRAPKFPSWASGFWQCKLRYISQEEVLRVAHEYKTRNIPLSVIVIDYFHWTEQGEWAWDKHCWPDVRAMVEELGRLGIHPVVSVWPTVSKNSEHYCTMIDRNLVLKAETGFQGFLEFFGPQTFVDVTNPEARDFMWDLVKKNYFDLGVHSYWLDVAEPEFMPTHYDNMKMYLGNGMQISALYPFLYETTFFDGLTAAGEQDILLLSRSAWLGSQRLGALVWSGDIASSFDSLRRQVKAGLHMSVCGFPWWNTDIGGFMGGTPSDPAFQELLVRWFQFGVFTPVMRLHGVRNFESGHVDEHPELLAGTGADNEVWSYGDEVYDILVNLIHLRERLRPYIHRHMEAASHNGLPLMRPMYLEYPADERCYELGDQYMFGSDILFAPIVDMGCRERDVYLPTGLWIDVRSCAVYSGEQTVHCRAELHEFIAFVRQDSPSIDLFL